MWKQTGKMNSFTDINTCQLIDGLTSHEGSAGKDELKKKRHRKGACVMRAAGLSNHEATYTAHYWHTPEPFTNLLVSSKLL